MNSKKIKKIIASCVLISTLLSGIAVSAAPSFSQLNTEKFKNSNEVYDGILRANVNDNGQFTYDVPVGATALETKEENWGDTKYTADRPFSWDNVNMYFVMTDRFVNGDSSNDNSYGRGLDANGNKVSGYDTREGYFHGGDLKGMTSKIEDGYFDNLGVNAIWITAPYEQIHGAMTGEGYKHFSYHGYWALDFTEVDKNMGTAEDLEKFIDTAHEHGIRVVFDIVMNHAGYANAIDADEYSYGGLDSNWKNVYYNMEDKQYSWWNDYAEIASSKGGQGMMIGSANWEKNWWGSSWVRMTQGRYGSYPNTSPENNDSQPLTTCLDGLPDFVTEGTNDPGIPPLLKAKWSASKLNEEEAEIDAFCRDYNRNRKVSTYLVKWLTDWVRDYGVDGFRCDTAKHVDYEQWNELKTAGVQALNEWRANNQDKPGADWTDDFWMTGEAWGHGKSKSDYFTKGGFDSMINFSYQGNESKTGDGLESLFADYAGSINSDENFNVLSYISSHDTSLGARSANAGTALLLTPGGVQVYYGDETGRQGDGTSQKQPTRSNMNWNSIDNGILSNYQKIGQFRSEHIAVGAGEHKKIEDSSVYTFSRTYNKNGISDKVVIALPGKSGQVEVSVGDIFKDGEEITDNYTKTNYKVSGGKVSVKAGENGVILLSEKEDIVVKEELKINSLNSDVKSPQEIGKVITFTAEATGEGQLTYEYSVDGETVKEESTSNTFEWEPTEDKEYTIGVLVKDADGNTKEKEVKYTITAPDGDGDGEYEDLKIKTLSPSIEKGKVGKAVTFKTETTGGKGNKSYQYTVAGEIVQKYSKNSEFVWSPKSTGTYKVKVQVKDEDNNEIAKTILYVVEESDLEESKEVSIKDMTFDKESPAQIGSTIIVDTIAEGKDLSYKYVINGQEVREYSEESSFEWTPKRIGENNIVVTVKSGDKEVSKKAIFNVTPLDINIVKFDIDKKDSQELGTMLTITSRAEGGNGDLQYRFKVVDKNEKEIILSDYSSTNIIEWTPEKVGEYTVYLTVKDATGTTFDSKGIKVKINNKVEPEDPDDGKEPEVPTETPTGTPTETPTETPGTMDGRTILPFAMLGVLSLVALAKAKKRETK